ncbi:glycosyltransferase family 39 protein [Candidatus Woesearchaeota archaeon]|nr:glycosyltransferase family 39 protein [Candidatus Woesearchaeota archaeon]
MEKIKAFLSKRDNQLLLLVMLLALIIRLYFFFKTHLQGLWWDEADYMTLAKNYAFDLPEIAAPWRAKGMSVLLGIAYQLGANEIVQRLIIIAFSVLAIYLTYLLAKELYNKKVALIASALMSVLWVPLFWAARFSAETFVLPFYILAGLFFWKGYIQNKSYWYLILSGMLLAYGIFVYESMGVFIPFVALFILVHDKLNFLKNKKFWYFMLGLLIVLPFVFYHYQTTEGSIYPRLDRVYSGSLAEGTELDVKLETQGLLSVIGSGFTYFYMAPEYLKWPLLILVLIGLYTFLDLFLGLDILFKTKDEKLTKDFFVIWWALSVLIMFGIYMAITMAYYEQRYIFPAYPMLMIIAARGIILIADFLETQKHRLGTLAIFILIIIVAVPHLSYANDIILSKATSFSQERAAGEWLKDHTEVGDQLIACTQAVPLTYYSERKTLTYRYNITGTDEDITNNKIKYLILDGYYFDCNLTYIQLRENNLTPVQAYYEGDQPIIVIFETNGYY